jgi:hypothetical protein
MTPITSDATPSSTGIFNACPRAMPRKAVTSPRRAALSSMRTVKTVGSLLR